MIGAQANDNVFKLHWKKRFHSRAYKLSFLLVRLIDQLILEAPCQKNLENKRNTLQRRPFYDYLINKQMSIFGNSCHKSREQGSKRVTMAQMVYSESSIAVSVFSKIISGLL